MQAQLMTYTQLRAALMERYQRPPVRVPKAELEEHLARRVFQPLEELMRRVKKMETLVNQLVTDGTLKDPEKARIVSEFQGILEQVLVDYQSDLLNVPNETVVGAGERRGHAMRARTSPPATGRPRRAEDRRAERREIKGQAKNLGKLGRQGYPHGSSAAVVASGASA